MLTLSTEGGCHRWSSIKPIISGIHAAETRHVEPQEPIPMQNPGARRDQKVCYNHLFSKARLITTSRGMVINAVASGAVLRALDKRNGPSRQARCSYGLLRLEPQDPEGRKGLSNAFTKDKWLRTIYWVIQKV